MDKEKCGVYTHTHAHTHTHSGLLHRHKKDEILPFVTTWIELDIVLTEISQTGKENTVIISLNCGI